MFPHSASYLRILSKRTWFFAKNVASILPQRPLPRPSRAAGRLPRSWERLPMVGGVQGQRCCSARNAIEKQWTQ